MGNRTTRRDFLREIGAAGAGVWLGLPNLATASATRSSADGSVVFRITQCPVPTGTQHAHVGVDSMLQLMAVNGRQFYQTASGHPWGAADGMIASDDIVLIKVNCQWKFRGATNTDVVRGLIYRILSHPDGFTGEVVIFENGQDQGAFNGDPNAWGTYPPLGAPTGAHVNAEDDTLTVNRLVSETFAGYPVTSFLLDPVRDTFIGAADHTTNGYRHVDTVSYPCFTTSRGTRVELREGVWTGAAYGQNLKLINVPVLKTHSGTGITGALKHVYGIVSMEDGSSPIRHYAQSGSQCGKVWTLVRAPVLNLVDCIWVSYQTNHCGYPPSTTYRHNVLLAGSDPVALDYWGSKHLLYPLGGNRQWDHNPDSSSNLVNHLHGARDTINAAGGIDGQPTVVGDENIEVISRAAGQSLADENWQLLS